MMLSSGAAILVIAAMALLPGETYRIVLQRTVQRENLTGYRITDSPDVGIPGRILLGVYLLLCSVGLVALGRFWWPGVVPDARVIGNDRNQIATHLLQWVLAGLVATAIAIALGAAVGIIQGTLVGRRVRDYRRKVTDQENQQQGEPDAVSVSLPWTRCSESWMLTFLRFDSPQVVLFLRDSPRSDAIAGRLLSADIFTPDGAGRGLLVEPMGADGNPDRNRRVFVRGEDVAAVIAYDGRRTRT